MKPLFLIVLASCAHAPVISKLDALVDGYAMVMSAATCWMGAVWFEAEGTPEPERKARTEDACHVVEDAIAETSTPPTAAQRAAIVSLWSAFVVKMRVLTKDDGTTKIEADKNDYDRLLRDIASGAPRSALVRELSSWTLEPTSRRLARFGEQAHNVAERLGKPDPIVTIEDNGIRLAPDRWAPFWTAFTHVIRNAVDHGIEAGDARLDLGKPERGTLTLRTFRTGGTFVVEVSDDGPGIDWAAVEERARSLGMAANNERELTEVIFADGVSTKHNVTQYSGRGVGLGASRAECEALGGRVSIETRRNVGTCFRFVFPESSARDRVSELHATI